jgi:hypothetical protein
MKNKNNEKTHLIFYVRIFFHNLYKLQIFISYFGFLKVMQILSDFKLFNKRLQILFK